MLGTQVLGNTILQQAAAVASCLFLLITSRYFIVQVIIKYPPGIVRV